MNTVKTLGLMVFMTLLLVFVGAAIGGRGGMVMAFAMAAIMNVGMYWFSDKIVLRMYKAQPVTEAEAPELHAIVRTLVQKAGLPMPKVYIIPDETSNAFATGRSPKHAVVACTDSIMRLLNKDELEAVLAHELSHVKNRDILTMTMASFIAMIASMIMQSFFFSALFGGRNRDSGGWIIVWIVSIIVYAVSTLLILALSRYREFAADRGSAYITQNPRALISALSKISGRMDVVPAEAKVKVEGANAFFIPFPGRRGVRV